MTPASLRRGVSGGLFKIHASAAVGQRGNSASPACERSCVISSRRGSAQRASMHVFRRSHWRLSSLPRYLQPEEVERVIAACIPTLEAGLRDRAILLLLARVGLRAGDILRLCLSDLDWKNATLCVVGKGRRQTLLPMTQEVGDALVAYIKDGRRPIDNDTLFIRSRAPFRPFATVPSP